MKKIRVGVLGCGTVGSSLIKLLQREAGSDGAGSAGTDGASAGHIAARTGLAFEITQVAVRDLSAERPVELPKGVLTTDAAGLVCLPEVDVVVETIGGVEPAAQLVATALESSKPVVTANKELLATCGKELFKATQENGVDLAFEAAVAAGIPLVSALRTSLVGERISRLMGIVNGTTNFILTKMTEEGADYESVLAEAQRLGYAEADPTADVSGSDAAAKAAILAMLAFGADVVAGDVYTEGIEMVSPADIAAAKRMGHVIKLLAVVERVGTDVEVRVHPTLVPADHPLGAVRDSFNAVFIQGESVGDLMLYGRGAGGPETASAVLGDLISVSSNLVRKVCDPVGELSPVSVRPIGETVSAYHVSMTVLDRPGVLAVVASVFGEHDVSIRSMEQTAASEGASVEGTVGEGADLAHIEFITHRAREDDVAHTLRALEGLSQVHSVGVPIRVVGD